MLCKLFSGKLVSCVVRGWLPLSPPSPWSHLRLPWGHGLRPPFIFPSCGTAKLKPHISSLRGHSICNKTCHTAGAQEVSWNQNRRWVDYAGRFSRAHGVGRSRFAVNKQRQRHPGLTRPRCDIMWFPVRYDPRTANTACSSFVSSCDLSFVSDDKKSEIFLSNG